MNANFNPQLPWYMWLLIAITLLCQGSWLFVDATRRGHKYRWFWGIWGLIQFPLPLILYLLFVRKSLSDLSNKLRNRRERNE